MPKLDETLWIIPILLPVSVSMLRAQLCLYHHGFLDQDHWHLLCSPPGKSKDALNMYLHSGKQAVAVWNIFLQTSYISASALIVSSPAHIHLGWVRMSSVQLFWDAGAAVMVPWKKTPLLVVPSQHEGAKRAKIKGAKTGLCLGFACVATREMHSRERNHC